MGEAKRRRLAGWIPHHNLRLECFIAQSTASDAHAVHLGIGRGQEVDIRRMDSFASIVDAWESLCQARKVLQKLKYHHNQDNNQITRNFIRLKHDTFGVLSNDDAMYSISGDINAAREWTSQGKRPGIDEPPPGVHIKVLNPPVQKKYKVLLVTMKGELIKSSCGNPEATCGFSVGKSHAEPFIIEGSGAPIYSSYVSAAYMADYVNTHNLDCLNQSEMLRLLYEANQLQGKV